jgi:hypothetical protein
VEEGEEKRENKKKEGNLSNKTKNKSIMLHDVGCKDFNSTISKAHALPKAKT